MSRSRSRSCSPRTYVDCSICLSKQPTCPVLTCCGHTFCWPCIYAWYSVNKTCPTCKNPLRRTKHFTPILATGSTHVDAAPENTDQNWLFYDGKPVPPRPPPQRNDEKVGGGQEEEEQEDEDDDEYEEPSVNTAPDRRRRRLDNQAGHRRVRGRDQGHRGDGLLDTPSSYQGARESFGEVYQNLINPQLNISRQRGRSPRELWSLRGREGHYHLNPQLFSGDRQAYEDLSLQLYNGGREALLSNGREPHLRISTQLYNPINRLDNLRQVGRDPYHNVYQERLSTIPSQSVGNPHFYQNQRLQGLDGGSGLSSRPYQSPFTRAQRPPLSQHRSHNHNSSLGYDPLHRTRRSLERLHRDGHLSLRARHSIDH